MVARKAITAGPHTVPKFDEGPLPGPFLHPCSLWAAFVYSAPQQGGQGWVSDTIHSLTDPCKFINQCLWRTETFVHQPHSYEKDTWEMWQSPASVQLSSDAGKLNEEVCIFFLFLGQYFAIYRHKLPVTVFHFCKSRDFFVKMNLPSTTVEDFSAVCLQHSSLTY